MKNIEKVLWIIFPTCAILRLTLIKNSDLFEGTSLILLGIFYLVWSFFQFEDISIFRKSTIPQIERKNNKKRSILAGIGSFLICIGCGKHIIMLLRKHEVSTGLNNMVFLGLIMLTGVLIVEIIDMINLKQYKRTVIFKKVIVGLILGSTLFYISGDKEVQIIYRNHPRFIKAFKLVKQNPENKELIQLMNKEHDKIIKEL